VVEVHEAAATIRDSAATRTPCVLTERSCRWGSLV
jgi:hypothetical protein